MKHVDTVVIGAGQAGGPLSTDLANAGWKTALVERKHMGGTCVNEGCAPTKTMIASARVAYLARRASDYGVRTGPVSVDMTKVRQRKRDIVESFRSGSQRRIERTSGLDLLMGEASFTGPKSVEVQLNSGETRHLTADMIFINAGARPRKPSLPGLDSVPYLDSTSIDFRIIRTNLLEDAREQMPESYANGDAQGNPQGQVPLEDTHFGGRCLLDSRVIRHRLTRFFSERQMI